MGHGTLSIRALAVTSAILWGAGILLVGIGNLIWPGYGALFLRVVSSIYPGYHATPAISSVLVGTAYALLDGAVGGAVFAWLYNRV